MTTTNLPARRTNAAVSIPPQSASTATARKRRIGLFGWFAIALIVAFFAGLMLNVVTVP